MLIALVMLVVFRLVLPSRSLAGRDGAEADGRC